MSILTIEPLRCPPEFYQELVKIFPAKAVKPEDDIREIMFNAGQQSVLEYIRQLISTSEISSDIAKLVKPASYTNRKVKAK